MQYRKFGNTGVNISTLGFGCMRFPEYEKDGKWYIDDDKVFPMLKKAYELGVNYFDTGYVYCHTNSEVSLGKGVKDFRDKVYISNKIPGWDSRVKKYGDYRRFLEMQLKNMDLEYLDFYHFWSLDQGSFEGHILKNDFIKEAVKAKEEGLIKHISFSYHGNPDYIPTLLEKAEVMETMLVQYNLLDRAYEKAIAHAKSKGLGVLAMGPVAGGRLAAPTDLLKKVTGKDSTATYELALKFVLSNQNIDCALSGMTKLEEVVNNAAIMSDENKFTAEDHAKILEAMDSMKNFSDLPCTGCKYCMPCTVEIDIPRLFEIYNMHNVYGLTNVAKGMYNDYKKNHPNSMPSACAECGKCEEICPQSIEIISKLRLVEKTMETLVK